MTLSNKIKWHQSDIHDTNKHDSFIMNFLHSKNKQQEQTRRCGKTKRKEESVLRSMKKAWGVTTILHLVNQTNYCRSLPRTRTTNQQQSKWISWNTKQVENIISMTNPIHYSYNNKSIYMCVWSTKHRTKYKYKQYIGIEVNF